MASERVIPRWAYERNPPKSGEITFEVIDHVGDAVLNVYAIPGTGKGK